MRLPDNERLKRGRAAVIYCSDPSCGKCLSACGFSAIRPGEGGLPFSDPAKCVGCGGCVSICPNACVMLLKDRGGGEYEFTVQYPHALPEIGDSVDLELPQGSGLAGARVVQVIPKRPNAVTALVRAAAKTPFPDQF